MKVLEQLGIVVGLVVLYYVVPVGDDLAGLWVAVTVFLAGVGVLVWLIGRHTLRVANHDKQARLRTLLMLLYVMTSFFALAYYAVAMISPGQFVGLVTRTDALYFTVTTIATVGFGDVHALGQVARAMVTIQMAFDLVILALLIGAYRRALRLR
ncbi:ion channel [Nonomuraea sp. NBC_01738]|uniref:ion channel n=1 Tax=Nonomuraea sp. NBC_01738 TaxID=2976003 RepID=UPI002E101EF1|nr:ion channel [Nonomuraea sp. NBC_01738]